MEKVIDFASYIAVKGFYNYLKRKDISIARKTGIMLTDIWYKVDSKRRNIAIKNIKNALKVNEDEAIQIARENYRHYGMMIGEIIKWEYFLKNFDELFLLEGFEKVNQYRKDNKGYILLTGHIGNWEIATIGFTKQLGGGFAIVKKIHNPYIDQLITSIRKKMGLQLITGKNTVFSMMKKIRNGIPLVFLLDQNAPINEAVFVDFFGKPASTFKVVALLSIKFNIPVFPAYCLRTPEGKFKIRIDNPFFPRKSGDLNEDVTFNTQKYTKFLEKVIRNHPEQWFWVHDRWKNQPE